MKKLGKYIWHIILASDYYLVSCEVKISYSHKYRFHKRTNTNTKKEECSIGRTNKGRATKTSMRSYYFPF